MPPQKTAINYRKFYFSFGVQLSSGSQLQGDCPFCSREDHFFVSPQTGQYDCKVCGESGNNWTFLRKFHEICSSSTTNKHYEQLASNRGLLPTTLRFLGIVYNPLNNRWLIPTNNLDGKLTNLYHAVPTERSFTLLSSPAPCVQQLYLGDTITSRHDTVWVAEGHWDAAAWLETLASLSPTTNGIKLKARPNYQGNLLHTNAVVGLPGATNFSKSWARIFAGKNVVLLHDNDPTKVICPKCRGRGDKGYRNHLEGDPCPKCGGTETTGQLLNPGKQGIERIRAILSSSKKQPLSLQAISWRPDDPKDIRDLLSL